MFYKNNTTDSSRFHTWETRRAERSPCHRSNGRYCMTGQPGHIATFSAARFGCRVSHCFSGFHYSCIILRWVAALLWILKGEFCGAMLVGFVDTVSRLVGRGVRKKLILCLDLLGSHLVSLVDFCLLCKRFGGQLQRSTLWARNNIKQYIHIAGGIFLSFSFYHISWVKKCKRVTANLQTNQKY